MMNNSKTIPQIIRLEEASSTNHYLRGLLARGPLPEGSVVVTENQTAGRGQIGNVWESEPGKNLTFSLVLYPDCIPANRQFLISQIAALSVKETLEAYIGDVTVKWPNDIYWKDKKICGMLIENDLSGHNMYCSVIGIGINVNQKVFRSNAPNPVSLWQIVGEETDKEAILNRFLHIFYNYYLWLLQEKQDEIRSLYRKSLYRGDGFFSFADEHGIFEASVYDIELTGHLILRLHNGDLRRYAFKEVSYV
ncbi:biotin--[acetyl-CoA-carboxylase] ligase [Parabacteroides chinchillae]